MSQTYTFRAVIQDPGGGGAYVNVPEEIEQAFGKKRVKIKAMIEGEPYRGTLVRMGGPCLMLLVLKEIREKTGKTFGDEIEVVLEEDIEPREVAVPSDLQAALDSDAEAAAFFAGLSFTHQKEYVQWIEEARREPTRQARVLKTIEMLRQGKRGH